MPYASLCCRSVQLGVNFQCTLNFFTAVLNSFCDSFSFVLEGCQSSCENAVKNLPSNVSNIFSCYYSSKWRILCPTKSCPFESHISCAILTEAFCRSLALSAFPCCLNWISNLDCWRALLGKMSSLFALVMFELRRWECSFRVPVDFICARILDACFGTYQPQLFQQQLWYCEYFISPRCQYSKG